MIRGEKAFSIFAILLIAALLLSSCSQRRVCRPETVLSRRTGIAHVKGPAARAYSHYLQGLLFERRDNLERAIEEFRQALSLDPASAAVGIKLGTVYFKHGQFRHSVSVLEKVLRDDADNIQIRMLLGLIQTSLGNIPAAIEQYELIVEQAPDHVQSRLNLADLYLLQKKPGRTAAIYEYLIDRNITLPFVYFNLSMLYSQSGRIEESIALLKQSIELEPKYLEAYLGLGLMHELREEPDKAESAYRAAIEIQQQTGAKSLTAYFRLAQLLAGQGFYDKAEEQFRKVLEIAPRAVEAYFELAHLYLKQERAQEAIAVLSEAAPLAEDQARLHVLTGMARMIGGDLAGAEESYFKSAQIEPDNEVCCFYLGVLYEKQGRDEEAWEQFYRVLEINPDNAEAGNYLGYMLAEAGKDLDEAVRLIQHALEIEPDNGAYIDSLGWAYYKLGKLDEARQYLERAVELIEDDPVVRDHLGEVYFKSGEIEKARIQWKKVLEIDPAHAKAREKLQRTDSSNSRKEVK